MQSISAWIRSVVPDAIAATVSFIRWLLPKLFSFLWKIFLVIAFVCAGLAATYQFGASKEDKRVFEACLKLVLKGPLPKLVDNRRKRLLGKTKPHNAICRGVKDFATVKSTPWVDWPTYWKTGDASTLATEPQSWPLQVLTAGLKVVDIVGLSDHVFDRDTRGLDGALLDLEFQRMELIRFNLFDNDTYKHYAREKKSWRDIDGPLLKSWDELQLEKNHPLRAKKDWVRSYKAEGGKRREGCWEEPIRYRQLEGYCNDIDNPKMGATGQLFGRNVQFAATFPRFFDPANRHGGRISLLKPDPQKISRELFSRNSNGKDEKTDANCIRTDEEGKIVPECAYTPASFF